MSIFSSCYLFRNSFSSTTIGDENPIRTLEDYSKPSHKGYRNTIELPVRNNMVPLRSDTIRERTRLRLFQFSLRDQASNWLERLLAGSITTWEDLTTRFLAQFFPLGRTVKLRNDILMFQQHHEESLSEAWTCFKDLLRKVPHHGIDLWLQVQIFYDRIDHTLKRTVDYAARGRLRKLSVEKLKILSRRKLKGEIRIEQNRTKKIKKITRYPDTEDLEPLNDHKFSETLTKEVYTPPVTYSKEVEETLGTLMEEEPLEQTKLEDVGLTNHNISLSSREVPSLDELEPQPQPLPSCPSFDGSLGNQRGPKPPIKQHSPDSFRMKEVDSLTINTPPSPHMVTFHPKDMYFYYHLCIDDPKKHYEFKPGLLRHSGSLGVDFLNFEIIEDDWLYLMRRNLEILRKFHWMILGGRSNQFSHVSSPLLNKPGEY
ncbi:zinc finger, CCHC-type containing protein [Tanacetum coccineum]